MGKFSGRVVVVTGGARGQGREHALAFAREGASVAMCDVPHPIAAVRYELSSKADLEKSAQMVEEAGARCLARAADVRDRGALEQFVKEVESELGPPDILCANAGILAHSPLVDASDEIWEANIGVNLTGVYNSMRAVLPSMLDRGYGRIVATSSACGRMGCPNLSAYTAAKWGVIGLVKSLALEVAPFGITVNAVVPGMIDTDMTDNPDLRQLFRPDVDNPTREDVLPIWSEKTPSGIGIVPPGEVSKAILFLASEDAGQVSGSTIDITGADSAHWTA